MSYMNHEALFFELVTAVSFKLIQIDCQVYFRELHGLHEFKVYVIFQDYQNHTHFESHFLIIVYRQSNQLNLPILNHDRKSMC